MIINKWSWQQRNPSCSSLRAWNSLNLSKESGTALAETAGVSFSCCTGGSQLHRDTGQWQWGNFPTECVERSLPSLWLSLLPAFGDILLPSKVHISARGETSLKEMPLEVSWQVRAQEIPMSKIETYVQSPLSEQIFSIYSIYTWWFKDTNDSAILSFTSNSYTYHSCSQENIISGSYFFSFSRSFYSSFVVMTFKKYYLSGFHLLLHELSSHLLFSPSYILLSLYTALSVAAFLSFFVGLPWNIFS